MQALYAIITHEVKSRFQNSINMRISQLRIVNYRSLNDVTLPITSGITVIIGENNAGKSAFVSALRLALPRGGQRRSGAVSDYDFHLPSQAADPKKSAPIEVYVTFEESQPDEWPNGIQNDLTDVIQTEPTIDIDSIYLRFTAKYDSSSKAYETNWSFLNSGGMPLTGKAASPSHFTTLLKYVVVFYLDALRDVAEEFSPRSQFWGQILKSLEIPDAKRAEVETAIEKLNEELLKADPNLQKVTATLERMHKVIVQGVNQDVSVRALPLRSWDLMSKSELVVRGRGNDLRLPLVRHGLGMQSLAVLFLFQAFVENLLRTTYKSETEAVLALEEPESHLHPQAVRALWDEVNQIGSQAIITTHSPYFVQRAPMRSLRLLRKEGVGTKAYWLRKEFSAGVPDNANFNTFISGHGPKYRYDQINKRLWVNGRVTEDEFRELLKCYTSAADRKDVHPRLAALRKESITYIDDTVLSHLETRAQRIRGEIFFARCWLLCEGQTEVTLLAYFAGILGKPLDANNVSLIDYQNNGAPGEFVSLARAFGFPWFMLADGDQGGGDHVKAVKQQEFEEAELKTRVVQLPEKDIEEHLYANGFEVELTQIAQGFIGHPIGGSASDKKTSVLASLRDSKGEWPAKLVAALRAQNIPSSRIPKLIKQLITSVVQASNA